MEERNFQLLNKAFILTAVLIVGILVFFVGEIFLQNKSVNLQSQYQITVSGQGKVYAKPDVAVISLGVTTQAVTVAEATTNNTNKMNAVIEAVKKLGVDEKDIQTTNYNLYPRYDSKLVSSTNAYYYGRTSNNSIIGYTLEQNVQVKIRDFEKIGNIMSGATEKGANLVGNLQFTIDNPEQFKEQARAKAIAQAKASAKNLAKESGISLGKLINVSENNYYTPMYSSSIKEMGMGAADSAPVPTIQPGQQEINITINLTYQVR